MKVFFCVFLLLQLSGAVLAQERFIKTVSDSAFGNSVRVLAAADSGWVLFSPDSLKLSKFSACGVPEWSRKYLLPGISSIAGLSDIVTTRTGGYIFFTRVREGAVLVPLLTRLDADGQVLWCRSYADALYNHFPYTLSEDAQGDFVLFGNAEHLNLTPMYNLLCRISANGDLLWSKFYNHGGTWGGGIITSDHKILARTGNLFFMTDAAGDVQWTSRLSSPNSHYYFAPVEIADGFVFTTFHQNNPEVSFHKLDKQGQLLWGGRSIPGFTARPSYLRKTPSGTFFGVFTRKLGSYFYATAAEMDKDLQILAQSSLMHTVEGHALQVQDFCLTGSGLPVLAGRAFGTTSAYPFFALADKRFRTACDTVLSAVTATQDSASLVSDYTLSTAHTFMAIPRNIVIQSFSVRQKALCSAPLQLKLGPDTTLCSGSSLALRNRSHDRFESWHWSTGETTAEIQVRQEGIYWVRGTYACGTVTATDTIYVSVSDFPEPYQFRNTSFCGTEGVILNALVPGAIYRWQDGSAEPQLRVSKPGNYFVDITVAACTRRFEAWIREEERVRMPNIFTPNDDGWNDTFVPAEYCGIAAAKLRLYNRWGKQVFGTREPEKGWPGTSGGTRMPDGIYYWILEYTTKSGLHKNAKGYVELLSE